MLKKLLLAGAFCLSFALTVQARTYYLPDYQMSFGNRSSQSNTSTSTHKPTCSAYGYYTADSRPSNAECTKVSIPGLTCYSCTICASSFSYNSSNCSGEYVLSGNSCGGKYNKCICDPAKYTTSADGSGCAEGEIIDTSKSCTNKTDGKTLYQCVTDPCYNLADNETELGCDKYYDQCPSKCQLGTTCKPVDCSAYTLASCPAGSTCESCTPGCGDTAPRYKAKKYKGLAFQVDSPAGGEISFYITGSNWQIDWGDGTIDTNRTHTYATAGLYDIDVYGDVKFFIIKSGLTAKPRKLYSLNLPQVTTIDFQNACSTLTGTIPEFPSSLTTGAYMFFDCKGLTGNIPTLPEGFRDGEAMFDGCRGLTGNIPELPNSLTMGRYMFSGCTGLTGTIQNLPTNLRDGNDMFSGCTGLTGDIPALPDSLTMGARMFYECSSLTGSIPKLPTKLTDGSAMFMRCSGLTGTVPSLPDSLSNAGSMFFQCSGLTGMAPKRPSGVSYSTTGTFYDTQVTNDGSWSGNAWINW